MEQPVGRVEGETDSHYSLPLPLLFVLIHHNQDDRPWTDQVLGQYGTSRMLVCSVDLASPVYVAQKPVRYLELLSVRITM